MWYQKHCLKYPVEIAITKFKQHPGINLINKNITSNESFHKKKNFFFIPTRLLKDVSNVFSPILRNIWNEEILLNKNFPKSLKLADVTSTFKEKDKMFVKNTDQQSFYQHFLRYSRKKCKNKLLIILFSLSM